MARSIGDVSIGRRTYDREVVGSTSSRVAMKPLVFGWVTVREQVIYRLWVYNQPPRSTQLSIPLEYVNQVLACMAGVKAGCVYLCQVSSNTV